MPDRRQRARAGKGKKPPADDGPPPARDSSPTGCEGWIWWQASKSEDARSPVKDDYYDERKIPVGVRAEFDKLRVRYRAGALRSGTNIKNIGDGVLELRYSHTGNTPYRLLFTRWGGWAVILDVFKKTTDETPKKRAVQRRAAWLKLFGNQP